MNNTIFWYNSRNFAEAIDKLYLQLGHCQVIEDHQFEHLIKQRTLPTLP